MKGEGLGSANLYLLAVDHLNAAELGMLTAHHKGWQQNQCFIYMEIVDDAKRQFAISWVGVWCNLQATTFTRLIHGSHKENSLVFYWLSIIDRNEKISSRSK